ncbi:MAG: proline--tRNA ligase, partial [Cyanobacteria bacterium P01_A01_bin.80]
MILAEAGEDEILYTEDNKYAANVEKAISLPADVQKSSFSSYEKIQTPQTQTIEQLCKSLGCSPTEVVKNVLYQATYDNGTTVLAIISIRGDQEVNEVKLQNELTKVAANYKASTVIGLTVPDAEVQSKWAAKPLPLGYIAPDVSDDYIISSESSKKQPGGIVPKFLRIIDKTAIELKNFVTGANEIDYHVVGANWGEQFKLPELTVDIRTAKVGDRAVHDPEQTLKSARGIEAGHIFQLGTKYSIAMGVNYTNEQGKDEPIHMGCYGVGVSRVAQAAIEQSYDKNGIIWPLAIAPYHVIVVVPNIKDEQQIKVGEKIYSQLNEIGIEVLLDDRNERGGVKFKDADLIGIPYRIVTGRAIANGKVELVERKTGNSQEISIDEIVSTIRGLVMGN